MTQPLQDNPQPQARPTMPQAQPTMPQAQEATQPMSPANNSKLRGVLIPAGFTIMFVGIFLVNLWVHSYVEASEQKIVMMEQQLESQEAVLQSVVYEFGDVFENLDVADDFKAVSEALLSEMGQSVALSSEEEPDGTFDVLILGNNGAHTDTIIIASVNEAKEKITLFSVPRDLYINGRRINQYYYYYGVGQLQRMLKTVTGLSIDKYIQVDLDGFEEVVDILGGLDIYVDKAIYDGYYPSGKGGYDPYSIDKGHYHMSGEEALKYARSRYSTSDFDRAERQQKILYAIRIKLLQLNSIMNMKELAKLVQAAATYVETDVSLLDAVSYYYDYKDFDFDSGFVLSNGNYLYSQINENGAYMLLPSSGNFEEIQEVISELVN